jgi:hypothetical protein
MACGTTIGSVIRETRLAPGANFRQRALNVAIAEIKRKTHLNIILESLEQAEHGRVTALIFAIRLRQRKTCRLKPTTISDERDTNLLRPGGLSENGCWFKSQLHLANWQHLGNTYFAGGLGT